MATRNRSRSPGGKAGNRKSSRPPRGRRAPATTPTEQAADKLADDLEREADRILAEHAAANPETESEEQRLERLADEFAAPTPEPEARSRKSRAKRRSEPASAASQPDPESLERDTRAPAPALPGFERAVADVDRLKGRAKAEANAHKAVKLKLGELSAALKASALASDDEFAVRFAAHGADLCLALRREIADLVEIIIEANSKLARKLGVDPESWR